MYDLTTTYNKFEDLVKCSQYSPTTTHAVHKQHTSIDLSTAMIASGRKKKLQKSAITASPKWSFGGLGLPLAVGTSPSVLP